MPACCAISSTDSSSSVRVASISTPRPMSWARRASGVSLVRLAAVTCSPLSASCPDCDEHTSIDFQSVSY